MAGIPAGRSKALEIVNAGNIQRDGTLISGAFIHALLIPHVACWISEEFALKVSKIVNDFLINEYKSKLNMVQREAAAAQQQLLIKDEQISNLQENLISSTATSISQAAELDSKITSLTEDLMDTNTKYIVATAALTSKKDELNTWASTHAFYLLNLNDSSIQMPYYAIRCKRRKMAPTIKRLRRKHPQAEIIFQHRRIPNAVNMYDRLRDEKLVKSSRNYCMPTNDEQTFKNAIEEMCGEQFKPDITLPL